VQAAGLLTAGTFGKFNFGMSLADQIASGLSQTADMTYGPSTMQIAFDGPDGQFELAAAAEGGTIDIEIGEGGVIYGGASDKITAQFGGSAIPFPPLSFTMDRSESRIQLPVAPDPDNAQDFGLLTTLEGLEVDDLLWGLIDPTGQIPRDPATIVLDLGGSAILTEDFTAPDFAENLTGAPGTLETLTLNKLLVSLAGAELTGDGDFTFNNDGFIPMPFGTANVSLSGGNALLDTLVAMGLIPEDQAVGARLMLGLFARPGDGPDTLVSTIEMKEDGSILANGQRIR